MDPTRIGKIGALLPSSTQENFKTFLRKNIDVFAWSLKDMPRISPSVITYWLLLTPIIAQLNMSEELLP